MRSGLLALVEEYICINFLLLVSHPAASYTLLCIHFYFYSRHTALAIRTVPVCTVTMNEQTTKSSSGFHLILKTSKRDNYDLSCVWLCHRLLHPTIFSYIPKHEGRTLQAATDQVCEDEKVWRVILHTITSLTFCVQTIALLPYCPSPQWATGKLWPQVRLTCSALWVSAGVKQKVVAVSSRITGGQCVEEVLLDDRVKEFSPLLTAVV